MNDAGAALRTYALDDQRPYWSWDGEPSRRALLATEEKETAEVARAKPVPENADSSLGGVSGYLSPRKNRLPKADVYSPYLP
jgi:hypothetical protein